MKKSEINSLVDIVVEVRAAAKVFAEKAETGNSKGEHKEFYRGQAKAYERCKTILNRFCRWHSIEITDV